MRTFETSQEICSTPAGEKLGTAALKWMRTILLYLPLPQTQTSTAQGLWKEFQLMTSPWGRTRRVEHVSNVEDFLRDLFLFGLTWSTGIVGTSIVCMQAGREGCALKVTGNGGILLWYQETRSATDPGQYILVLPGECNQVMDSGGEGRRVEHPSSFMESCVRNWFLSGLIWTLTGNQDTLDAWQPMRIKWSWTTCWSSTTEPAVLQTDTRGRKRLWAPENGENLSNWEITCVNSEKLPTLEKGFDAPRISSCVNWVKVFPCAKPTHKNWKKCCVFKCKNSTKKPKKSQGHKETWSDKGTK